MQRHLPLGGDLREGSRSDFRTRDYNLEGYISTLSDSGHGSIGKKQPRFVAEITVVECIWIYGSIVAIDDWCVSEQIDCLW